MSPVGWETAGLLALGISLLAWRMQALNVSGLVMAWGLGTVVFHCGSWWAAATLLTFFITSSLLSRLGPERKRLLVLEYAKGNARDGAQVMANGGLAALSLLLTCLGLAAPPITARAFLGALAAATADTWATELGGLARHPRHVLTGRTVRPGASGGISPAGLLASLAGGGLIGLVGGLPWPAGSMAGWGNGHSLWGVLLATGLAGLLGSLVDSVLGATVQATYWCPTCHKETERRLHHCGTATVLHRGHPWVSNDVVNFVATLVGAIISILPALLAFGPG